MPLHATTPITIGTAGDRFDFGGFAVHWKVEGPMTDGRVSIVHHPMAPHALAAPLHCHRREDEWSYVISGKLGALLGANVVTAEVTLIRSRGRFSYVF